TTKGICMIGSFGDKQLEAFWKESVRRGIPTGIENALRRKLTMIAISMNLSDLRVPPANRLEALRGNRQG
ncbi:MAG: type II toxin-antitoxin system RelE/ParE family toxin, partial [Planctomycetota bacterium]|nr:type II toxin-antitoxin system RelE/ParE family toxin [Planctomycetota bacterium]